MLRQPSYGAADRPPSSADRIWRALRADQTPVEVARRIVAAFALAAVLLLSVAIFLALQPNL